MSSLLDEWIKREHNRDGTMKPERRLRMQKNGWSKDEINQIEQMHIRRSAIDREVAQWNEQLERQRWEWEARQKEARRQRDEELAQMGTEREPTVVTRVDFSAMSPKERRDFEMAGLDWEELLSQGFLEPDDFYEPETEVVTSKDWSKRVDPNWEPEGGWVEF